MTATPPMLRHRAIVAALLLLFSALALPAHARPIPDWNYQKLFDDADTVAVVEALGSSEVSYDFANGVGTFNAENLQAWETRLKILAIYKGPAMANGELTLLHFRYKPSVHFSVNGMITMRFPTGPREVEWLITQPSDGTPMKVKRTLTPQWLAFLTKRTDGRYMPVSGPYDSALSFKSVGDNPLIDDLPAD